MRTRGVRGVLVVVLAGIVALGGIGVAHAYLVGTGSGAATTGVGSPVTLAPATTSGGLYPGGSATVAVTATNRDPAAVQVNGLALDTSQGTGGFAVDANHSGCGLGTFSFTTQTNGGAGWQVPAGGSSTISLISSVTATTSTANSCQGASLTVYLKASP